MNSQKAKVHYKQKQQTLDFDLIQNLEQLCVALNILFNNLPREYDISLENPSGSLLTNEEIKLLKLYGAKEVKLFISQAKDDFDIESIASELSKIQILENNVGTDKQQKQELKKQSTERNHQKLIFEEEKPFEQSSQNSLKDEKKLQILNEDVQCNGCFAFPIQGVIYKCIVCSDYDLCSKCEESKHHFHPMLKIAKKGHYPIHLRAVFSKKSKVQMERLAELAKIEEQSLKKIKYQNEVQDYKILDPSTLPSKKICQKNFLSEIVSSVY